MFNGQIINLNDNQAIEARIKLLNGRGKNPFEIYQSVKTICPGLSDQDIQAPITNLSLSKFYTPA